MNWKIKVLMESISCVAMLAMVLKLCGYWHFIAYLFLVLFIYYKSISEL